MDGAAIKDEPADGLDNESNRCDGSIQRYIEPRGTATSIQRRIRPVPMIRRR